MNINKLILFHIFGVMGFWGTVEILRKKMEKNGKK